MRLIDPKTGKERSVPYEQGGPMFISGQASLPKDQGVYLLSPTGELGVFTPESVYDAVKKGEYMFPTDSQINEHERRQKYSGRNLEAAALSAADFTTFGGATAAGVGLGLMDKETPGGLAEFNPISHNVVGPVIGMSLSPESWIMKTAGEAVKTANALKLPGLSKMADGAYETAKATLKAVDSVNPMAQVSRAADKTFDLLANIPKTASSTQKAMAQMGLAGARGAFDASLYTVSDINRKIITDPELTVQEAMGQLGLAAVLGGGLGTLMSGVGQGAKAAKSVLSEGTVGELTKEIAKDVAKGFVGAKAVSLITGGADEVMNMMGAAAGIGGIGKYSDILMKNSQISNGLQRLKALQEKAQSKITSLAKQSVEPISKALVKSVPIVAKTVSESKGDNEIRFKDEVKQYKEITKYLNNITLSPKMYMDTLEISTRGVADIDTAVASEVQRSVVSAMNLLESKKPKPTQNGYPFSKQESLPSKTEITNFLNTVRTIEDPFSVLKSLKTGKISINEMEVMKTVYPKLLDSMRLSVMEEVIKQKGPVSYQKRMALGMFLGQDMDSSLNPMMVASNQMTFAKVNNGGSRQKDQRAIKPTQKGLGSLDLASRSLLPIDKAAMREEP